MKQGRIETITTRIISTTFMVVALAVFKPFGLDAWQWQAYVHLVALGVIGFSICMMTDVILKYVVKMPRSFNKGAEYIIRRNLWFQFINTPLVALGICLYRHLVLSNRVGGNQFSVVNFLETLVIIAFCSYAIGLYWRFKFRSKYLAMELEEIRELNERLKSLTPSPSIPSGARPPVAFPKEREVDGSTDNSFADKGTHSPLSGEGYGGASSARDGGVGGEALTLTGTTNESVTLQIFHLLFIEAVATMKQMEETLQGYPMIVRCHRAFLVNLGQVEQIVSHSGSTQLLIKHCHESIPVSRSNMSQVKAAIKREES